MAVPFKRWFVREPPSLKEVTARRLYEAELLRLQFQGESEHATAMAHMLHERIVRLKKELGEP